MAQFQVLSQNLPGGTEEKHEKSQSGQQVVGPRFELGTSRIQGRSGNHSAATFRVRCYTRLLQHKRGPMTLKEMINSFVVIVNKPHASRPRKDFTPISALLEVNSTTLLRC
jgi:hypothetical protein